MGTADPEVRNERLSRLAWSLAAVWLACWLVTVAFLIANRSAIHSYADADLMDVVLPVGFAVIGTLVASRQPRNPIGWILLTLGLLGVVSGVITQYVYRSVHFTTLPLAAWVAWLHDPLNWVVFPAGLATFFFLLFPDGHLPSRRWRWLARFAVLVVALGFVLLLLQRTITIGVGTPTIPNPLGSVAAVDMENGAPGLIWLVALAVLLSAIVGVVLRTRRSTGELRQQLRWLAFAAAVTGVAMLVLIVGYAAGLAIPDPAFDLVILFGFGFAVPVACGVAVLKHGLYDLDVVISKTVVYAVLAAFFTIAYLAIVVGIGTAIGSSNNSFLTVLAAATIAVAFNPVRDRAKRFANRLVYGERASPYEVLSEFSERVAETYSVEDVLPRMATALGEGTGARDATVWLRVGAELRPSATWGNERAPAEPIPIANGDVPVFRDVSKVAPVRHRDELLGALTVTKPPNDPLSVPEAKLVDDLAAQAGLVLRNVRLTEELRANLEELRASRQRLVTAQDGERRRIERNIHDGAQQRLVALAVQARIAEGVAGTDPDKARDLLQHLQAAASAGRSPGPGARDLSAAARRPGARRRGGSASAPVDGARDGGGFPRRSLLPGGGGSGVLLHPGGAPERRQVRRGVGRDRRVARQPERDPLRRSRRRTRLRSGGHRVRDRRPGYAGSPRGARRCVDGGLGSRSRNDGGRRTSGGLLTVRDRGASPL
jgi:signal transduction histidine kinase